MELHLFITALSSWCIASANSLSNAKLDYFKAKSKIYDCPDLVVTEHEGTLSSPSYPETYPSHLSCSWHIQGKIGEIITITFNDLDIEESCCCDHHPCCPLNWLKIGPLINGTDGKFCGEGLQGHHSFTSSSNKLLIKFHISDFKKGGRGFRFHYKIGPNSTSSSCQSNEFKCNNNECVPSKMRCNGFPDCEDGSDEFHCSNKCSSGRSCRTVFQCYDAFDHCNGKGDCPDYSDEIDCGFCAPNLTRCGSNSTVCYNPLTQRCDRIFNCLHGEDEVDCFGLCPGKIPCESRRGCYTTKQRCNGVTQCEDASDERNCVPELCNYEHGGFLCDNGRCIQEVWTCDRTDDCGDGSDERNCLRNSVLTAALMGSLICALLLVIAISCTCRLHALRMLENRLTTNRETPLSRMSREFFFREPPPSYAASVQSEPHRSLCVENLHYGVQVHRGRRRSRRPRHNRGHRGGPVPCNCTLTNEDRTVPAQAALEVSVLDDATAVPSGGVILPQSPLQSQDNKEDSSNSDSNEQGSAARFVVGNKSSRNESTSSSVVLNSSSPETVSLETLAVAIEDPHSSSIETPENYFHCDSDTDPLVV